VGKTKKYRQIRILNNKDKVIGVSLPKFLNNKWLNVFVTVTESGNSIILESGTKVKAMNNSEINNISSVINKIKI